MANIIGDKKNYVHWFLGSLGYGRAESDDTNNVERYENIMNNFINQINNGNYSAKILHLYQKNLSSSLGFNISHWRHFAAAANDLILSRNFLNGLDTSFQSLSSLKTMSYHGITNESIKDAGITVKKLSDLLNGFDNFIKLVLKMNSTTPNAFFKFLANQKGVDIPKDVKLIFNKLSGYSSKEVVQIYDSTIRNIINRAEFKKIEEYGENLKQKNSSTYKYLKNSEMSNEAIASFVNEMNGTLNKLAGLVHEALVAASVNMITNYLIKQSLNNSNIRSVEITGTGSAQDQSLNFSTNTMDLKINGKDGSAQINVYIPSIAGASLKRKSNFNENKDLSVNIKNSNLEKLLHLANVHGLWDANVNNEAFYNIMADHRRHTSQRKTKRKDGREVSTGSNSYYYYSEFDEMTKAMNKMFLIFGLAGGMTKEDFSTHLIVNDKIFSIADILARIGGYDVYPTGGLTESFQAKIRASHEFEASSKGDYETLDREAGKRRSDKIIDFILKSPISLNLVIRHQILKKLNLR